LSRQQEELIVLNFPPPPEPPIDASQLKNLAEYYRQLVDYCRRASEIAANQLSHVEALLPPPNSELMFSSEIEGWLSSSETHQSNGNRELAFAKRAGGNLAEPIPQLSATAIIENGQKDFSAPNANGGIPQHNEETFENNSTPSEEPTVVTEETLLEVLAIELESNRGKMLHLDYLVRKLYGEVDSSFLESATEETKALLGKGTAQQRWFAVPDAPDCWTIDLKEFPDLTEPPKPSGKKPPSSHPRKTLVGSERLARYATVAEALAACLEEHYPNSMTSEQIADYFYPDGLSKSKREKVLASLGKALSKGNNKSWRRVRVGQYICHQGTPEKEV
jgi:hypothetical protein